jgi:pimeloyl-ACP methyl ester carboxylesterase
VTRLPDRVLAWERSGEYIDVGGRRIFVRCAPGDATRTALLLLHGFPSSSYDWRLVLPRLTARPVMTFDFLGFGLSDKPADGRYSLHEQADVVEAVVGRFAGGRAIIVAHDMGTSVTTELLARDLDGTLSFALEKALLMNGSVVIDRAVLTRGQRLLRSRIGGLLARLSTRAYFRHEFAKVFSPGHPLSAAEAADQWALLHHHGGNQLMHRLIHYIDERYTYAERWHGAVRDSPRPVEFAWGLLDPVAVEAVLDALISLRPAAPVTRWPQLGHYPQLEQPEAVAAVINAL